MRLSFAQMKMSSSVEENLDRTLDYMALAANQDTDLIFFPEIQLSPFFPQYEKRDASPWLMRLDGSEVQAIRDTCRELGIWASPNLYLEEDGKRYDASLMIRDDGEIVGISRMVHISQARYFYEQDYYDPSPDGFRVWDTPFGKIGIVICFDRHVPDGIRSCAKQGAELVLVPTANIIGEPLELFAWEMRVQAFQNTVFIEMCNRVGVEDRMAFAGQSLLAGPQGNLEYQVRENGENEMLLTLEVPLEEVALRRKERPWLAF